MIMEVMMSMLNADVDMMMMIMLMIIIITIMIGDSTLMYCDALTCCYIHSVILTILLQ